MASGDDSNKLREKDLKPLFPVVAEQIDNTRQYLFSVTPDSSRRVGSRNREESDLDWLENKSYIPTALLLAEEERSTTTQGTSFTPETCAPRKTELGSQQSSFDKEKQGTHETEFLKRSLSVSESDDESSPVYKAAKQYGCSKTTSKKKHKKERNKRKLEEDTSKRKWLTGNSKDRPDSPSEIWKNQPVKTFLQELPGLKPEFAFRLDRKSEKSLWNYESVYKGHIAHYRRVTDKCLGNIAVQLSEKKEKGKDISSRYYSKDKHKQLKRKGQLVTVDKCVANKTTDFIAIQGKDHESECSSHSKEVNDPHSILDSATSLYVEGKGRVTGKGTEEESITDETLERTAYYNRLLREDPSNIKVWMEFISFQDNIFQGTQSSTKSMANKRMTDSLQPPRACIEKKLAIIEKALEANPSSLDLKLLKLEIEQDVSDLDTMTREWDKLLFVHAADLRLWRHYLMFQQSRLATFTVSRTVKLYHHCFKTVSPILENKEMKRTETFEEELLGVLEQYCMFLHQCGHTEKAVASYQAIIEFNLFQPPSLNLTPAYDSAVVFESFWDSGVARFGESGAEGWASWVNAAKSPQNHAVCHVSTEEEQEQILQKALPLWQSWLKLEYLRQQVHWLPWRPDTIKGETEEDCEDLDRLVLYDDIAPVLLRLEQSASLSRLVHSFVDLLGLVQWQRMDDGANHFEQMKLSALYQVPVVSGVCGSIPVDSRWQPCRKVVCFLEEVLRQSAAYFTGWQRTLFSCQLLRLQIEKHGCQDVTSLSDKIAKDIRKFGKNLLKEVQNRNDLFLWNKYIRNEWAFGKTRDAMSMLQTALAMFTGGSSGDDHTEMAGLCSLYHTLAEMYLNFTPLELILLTGRKSSPSVECKNKVVRSLICLIDTAEFCVATGESVPGAQILRARRKFQNILTSLVSDSASLSICLSSKQHIIDFVNCFALFELCAAGLTESVQVFDTVFQLCTVVSQKGNSSQVKLLYTDLEKDLTQNLLILLKNYMSVSVVTISRFRSRLETALSRFPNEPWFLDQFVVLESKTFMAQRLRRYFETTSKDPSSVYPVLFGILAEMTRHINLLAASSRPAQAQEEHLIDSGTVHRVRTVCERGLQHKVAEHCVLVWRLFLAFEGQYGSLDRAKGVLYRALQACPWAKVLYMDGAELFGEKQFQELMDLMTEKELRVQTPLEEVELMISSESQDVHDGRERT